MDTLAARFADPAGCVTTECAHATTSPAEALILRRAWRRIAASVHEATHALAGQSSYEQELRAFAVMHRSGTLARRLACDDVYVGGCDASGPGPG